MAKHGSPRPDVMPIDREAWLRQLHLSNFVNTYYQFRDVTMWIGTEPSILIIGPGQGLDAHVLKWRKCRVTTFDIDHTFEPDVVGSCHDMPMFGDAQFDVVIASHVLEHLPVAYLDLALTEIARVGRNALVYLPVAGRHMMLRIVPGFKGIEWTSLFDLQRFWERPDGAHAKYCGGQHYWEIGYRGFRLRDVRRRFERHFEILRQYRNRDWIGSHNFVMRSKRHTAAVE
jgi:predicted SAM-dependent methyltransferase